MNLVACPEVSERPSTRHCLYSSEYLIFPVFAVVPDHEEHPCIQLHLASRTCERMSKLTPDSARRTTGLMFRNDPVTRTRPPPPFGFKSETIGNRRKKLISARSGASQTHRGNAFDRAGTSSTRRVRQEGKGAGDLDVRLDLVEKERRAGRVRMRKQPKWLCRSLSFLGLPPVRPPQQLFISRIEPSSTSASTSATTTPPLHLFQSILPLNLQLFPPRL